MHLLAADIKLLRKRLNVGAESIPDPSVKAHCIRPFLATVQGRFVSDVSVDA